MLHKIPKILIYFFLIVFILQLAGLILLLILPQPSQAINFTPQVDIGGPKGAITGSSIGEYVKAIYKYAIGIVGILAAVVMMIGGVMWIMSGGNAERAGNAKAWIGASLTGLILTLCSYMILKTVNPDLVKFEPLYVPKVEEAPANTAATPEPTGCCTIYSASFNQYVGCEAGITRTDCEKKNKDSGIGFAYGVTEVVFHAGKTCHEYSNPKYNPCETYEFGCCLYNWDSPRYKDCDNNITFEDCEKKSGLHRWHQGKTCKHLDAWPYNNWVCE